MLDGEAVDRLFRKSFDQRRVVGAVVHDEIGAGDAPGELTPQAQRRDGAGVGVDGGHGLLSALHGEGAGAAAAGGGNGLRRTDAGAHAAGIRIAERGAVIQRIGAQLQRGEHGAEHVPRAVFRREEAPAPAKLAETGGQRGLPDVQRHALPVRIGEEHARRHIGDHALLHVERAQQRRRAVVPLQQAAELKAVVHQKNVRREVAGIGGVGALRGHLPVLKRAELRLHRAVGQRAAEDEDAFRARQQVRGAMPLRLAGESGGGGHADQIHVKARVQQVLELFGHCHGAPPHIQSRPRARSTRSRMKPSVSEERMFPASSVSSCSARPQRSSAVQSV